MYDFVSDEEIVDLEYGLMYQYYGVFQVGAWWEYFVQEEATIPDPVNAPHTWKTNSAKW